jgi:hypothetical protein
MRRNDESNFILLLFQYTKKLVFPPIPKKAAEVEEEFELPGDISAAVEEVVALREEYTRQQRSSQKTPAKAPMASSPPPPPSKFPDLEVFPIQLKDFNAKDIRISVSKQSCYIDAMTVTNYLFWLSLVITYLPIIHI